MRQNVSRTFRGRLEGWKKFEMFLLMDLNVDPFVGGICCQWIMLRTRVEQRRRRIPRIRFPTVASKTIRVFFML